MKFEMKDRTKVGLISDEGMVKGFKMTGLVYDHKNKNFHVATPDMTEDELEKIFEEIVIRPDISIVFVGDFVAKKIQIAMNKFKEVVPTILIIPTKTGGCVRRKNN